jgi:hypothetical protein
MSFRLGSYAIAIVVVLGAAAGCTSDAERYTERLNELVAQHTASLNSMRAKLQAVQAAARAHPPLQPIAAPWNGPPVDARPTAASPLEPNPGCNAVAMLEDQPLDVYSTPDAVRQAAAFYPDYHAGKALALLAGYRPPYGEYQDVDPQVAYIEQDIARVERLSYAVACRTIVGRAVVVDPSYVPGLYQGECRLFEIAGARYLGGFPLQASTGESETVWTGGTSGAASSQLSERMRDQIVGQIDAALAPTGAPQHSVWYAW